MFVGPCYIEKHFRVQVPAALHNTSGQRLVFFSFFSWGWGVGELKGGTQSSRKLYGKIYSKKGWTSTILIEPNEKIGSILAIIETPEWCDFHLWQRHCETRKKPRYPLVNGGFALWMNRSPRTVFLARAFPLFFRFNQRLQSAHRFKFKPKVPLTQASSDDD